MSNRLVQGLDLPRFLVLFSVLIAGQAMAAEPARLGGAAIKDTVTGSLVELDTPLGTTVPIRFTGDGLMSGDAKELAALLGAQTDRGRWWVAEDRLCYKWFRWFDAETRCADVSMDGTRIFWRRDDGETGTATLIEQGKPAAKPAPPATVVAQAAPTPPQPTESESSSALVGQKFATASIMTNVGAPEPAASEAKPTEATSPVTAAAPAPEATASAPAAAARPSMYPAKENLLPTRRRVVPAVPLHRVPVQAEKGTAVKQTAAAAQTPAQVRAPAAKGEVKVASAMPPSGGQPSRMPVALSLPSFRVIGVGDYDVLNIRSGPSQDRDSIGAIPPNGRGIRITGTCKDDWCPIRHAGASGWVNRYYLAQELAR